MKYTWVPQSQFSKEAVINELKNGDAGIIDVGSYKKMLQQNK